MNIVFLLNRLDQPGWVRDIIRTVQAMPAVSQIAFVVGESDPAMKLPLRSKIADTLLAVVQRLEARQLTTVEHALFHREDICAQFKEVSISHLSLPQSPSLADRTSGPTPVFQNNNRPSIVLALAMQPARDALLLHPEYGYWSFSYSLSACGADRHAGMAEVSRRDDHTCLSLLRLAPRPGDDQIIHQRRFNTDFFWLKNKARAVTLSKLVAIDAIAALHADITGHKIAVGKKFPPALAFPAVRPTRRPPGIGDVVSYVAKQTALSAAIVFRKLAKRDVYWRIGISNAGSPPFGKPGFDVLTAPKGRFFADPFVITQDDQVYVFFEDYAVSDRRGKISAARYVDGKFEFLGVVLDLPYHLSFPYVFAHAGTVYMLPETSGNRTIELWRCTDFPLQWEREVTLMDDVSAVDSILFPHANLWWLLTNIDRSGGVSHSDELFAFYADSPLSTSWTAHAHNPIVHDPSRARNGGMFISDSGEVIRAAQYQGFCHYGKGVSLNTIKELTPNTYIEAPGAVHYADFVTGVRPSAHHCHRHGRHTVFDFSYIE